MSNEFNAKNGLRIQNTQPVSGISNTTIINNDNSLVTEGQIYRELTGKTSNDIFSAYTATTYNEITNLQNTLDTKTDLNLFTGHTGDTSIHFTKESLNGIFVNVSGDTMTGTLYGTSISANTISATTFYGDGSNLTGISGSTSGGTTYTSGSGITISSNTISVNIVSLPEDVTPEASDYIMYSTSGGTLEKTQISALPITNMLRYSLPEGINNTAVYFYSWSKTSSAANAIRSGNSAGIPYADACSPIQISKDGYIATASLTLGGAGVQAGTPIYPVVYSAQVWSVSFGSEGILRGILTWDITSGFTVGGYSVTTTNYSGTTGNINIPCYGGDLLALKFYNGNSASSVGQMLNAFVSVTYKHY